MMQLLVSVRSVDEAIAAITGGADIIDIKEPNSGSLGCATPLVISQIAEVIGSMHCRTRPLSLALGELAEWRNGDFAQLRAAVQAVAPQFLKLGLASSNAPPGGESWCGEWRRIRTTMPGQHAWVAVAYADYRAAGAPQVECVLRAGIEADCKVLLIDTHTKNGMSLLEHMSLESLRDIRHITRINGLKLALAGSVSAPILPQLLSVEPDIIAVRGAVCEHGDRTATVSSVLVHEFRYEMERAFGAVHRPVSPDSVL